MKNLFNKLFTIYKDKGFWAGCRTILIYFKSILDTPAKQRKRLKKYVAIHNKAYEKISKVAIKLNNGIHPKHAILNYNKFFLNHIDKNDLVLDAGCGQGQVAAAVAGKASKVIGVDINKKNIKQCKNNFQRDNLKYLEADLNNYNPELKFDKIILSNVLEHIDDRIGLLKKMAGFSDTLLLRVPMITRDWVTVYKKNMGLQYKLDKTHFIEYTLDELTEELQSAGWQIEFYQINWGEFWGVIKAGKL